MICGMSCDHHLYNEAGIQVPQQDRSWEQIRRGIEAEIKQGKYFEDVFKSIFVKNYYVKKNFIGIIPFVRNLFEYLSKDDEYDFLTSCLHIKSTTLNITVQDVHDSLIIAIPEKNNVVLEFADQKLIDLIFNEADSLKGELSEHSSDLEDKLLIA